jgi:GDPmannose 4,6-dehydratase
VEIAEVSKLKTALILGVSGQDGYYLSKLLLGKGYRVVGTTRNNQSIPEETSLLISKNCEIVTAEIRNTPEIIKLIKVVNPDEIYNLSGVSSVAYSFENKEETLEVNTYAFIRLLEALKENSITSKVYQASSSEMFGKALITPQTEVTPLNPVSPYGTSKALAHNAARRFRDEGLFVSCGILYNHESPIRPINFVTRKITQGIARIKLGLADNLHLGSLEARRDWGFAGDYVDAMWRMLQFKKPDDFIIASGETHSVYEFVEKAIQLVGLKGAVADFVISDSTLIRPAEISESRGNPAKALSELGWKREVDFENLIKLMIKHDLDLLSKEWNIHLDIAPGLN